MMKVCSKCGDEKPLSKFHKDKRIGCGYRPDCKECRKPITKAYSKKAVAKMKERYKNDPEYRMKAIANARKFHNTNSGEITEQWALKLLQRDTPLTFKDLRQYPELIQAKQEQLKIQRELKYAKYNLPS